jgi:hydrogenase maturation protease
VNRVVVLAWGNPSRGDDAIGPRLAEALEAQAARHPEWARHAFVTDFQLQPEHALDLEGADLVLFVDASATAPAPFAFTRVGVSLDRSFTTHALSPQALLAVRAGLAGEPVPPAWLLAVRGEGFELGQPMRPAAREGLTRALELAARLLSRPDPAYWERESTPTPAFVASTRSTRLA